MNQLEPIAKHFFVFNENQPGGEQIILTTKYYNNGYGSKKNIYCVQELELNSFGNIVTFTLDESIFSSHNLRKLADELDEQINSINKRNN